MKCLMLAIVNPYVLMSFATAKAVANLANSAGCKRIGPSTSHEREPLISCGLKMVINSSSMRTA